MTKKKKNSIIELEKISFISYTLIIIMFWLWSAITKFIEKIFPKSIKPTTESAQVDLTNTLLPKENNLNQVDSTEFIEPTIESVQNSLTNTLLQTEDDIWIHSSVISLCQEKWWSDIIELFKELGALQEKEYGVINFKRDTATITGRESFLENIKTHSNDEDTKRTLKNFLTDDIAFRTLKKAGEVKIDSDDSDVSGIEFNDDSYTLAYTIINTANLALSMKEESLNLMKKIYATWGDASLKNFYETYATPLRKTVGVWLSPQKRFNIVAGYVAEYLN